MACPFCKRHQLVEITVQLGDTKARMRSCSDCGLRWWDVDGAPVDLAEVLVRATVASGASAEV